MARPADRASQPAAEAAGGEAQGDAPGQAGQQAARHHPGIGPITALTLALEVDPSAFQSGRHLAAWLELTPQQHSTPGKQHLGSISRAGNERLHALLVSGAMEVIRCVERPGSKLSTEWLCKLPQRRPRKLAVALANKMARIAWALMVSGKPYRHPDAARKAAA